MCKKASERRLIDEATAPSVSRRERRVQRGAMLDRERPLSTSSSGCSSRELVRFEDDDCGGDSGVVGD